MFEIVDIPEHLVEKFHRTGSSVICSPPVLDTDIDYVILVDDKEEIRCILEDKGWKICGKEAYYNPDNDFIAFRKENLNYIIVNDVPTYDRWEAATLLATKRNLLDKADRVALFKNIHQRIQNAN